MRYSAKYSSNGTHIKTRRYSDRREAWEALARGLERHGIDPGLWHRPGKCFGEASGDGVFSRAGGTVEIFEHPGAEDQANGKNGY